MIANPDDRQALRPGLEEGLSLLLLALIWGSSFLFIRISLEAIPPLTLAALRILLAAVCLWGVLAISRGLRSMRSQNWQAFTIMGVLNNVLPFSLIIWSQLTIPSGLAAILVATTPLLGLISAALLLPDEPVTRNRVLACGGGLAGVILIAGTQSLRGDHAELVATAACLLGAASFALAGVFGRRFARDGIAPLTTATGQVTASSCLLTPIALLAERPWTLAVPSLTIWVAALALGVISTAFAYVLYFRILARAGTSNILLVNLLIPLPAILFGTRWLHESLRVEDFVGLVLISGALLASDTRLWRRRQPV